MSRSCIILLFSLISTQAFAHPQDLGVLNVKTQDSNFLITLELGTTVAARITNFKEAIFENDKTVAGKAPALFDATLGRADIILDQGVSCAYGGQKVELLSEKLKISLNSKCSGKLNHFQIRLAFLAQAPKGFELVVRSQLGARAQEFLVTAEKPIINFTDENPEHSWQEFIALGVHHIGATPSEWVGPQGFHFPDGIDHILFVIALVLGGGGAIGILKTVTGFTLGHSVTLAMATLGIVHVPSRLVESAIALSISIVAAESLIFMKRVRGKSGVDRGKWKIALLFGLVHGLGFASALSELHLDRSSLLKALVGFNVGVEMGQAIIVAFTLPLVSLLHLYAPTRRFAVPACAFGIFAAGSFWFIQRAFL